MTQDRMESACGGQVSEGQARLTGDVFSKKIALSPGSLFVGANCVGSIVDVLTQGGRGWKDTRGPVPPQDGHLHGPCMEAGPSHEGLGGSQNPRASS
jgi:hypothetical protein